MGRVEHQLQVAEDICCVSSLSFSNLSTTFSEEKRLSTALYVGVTVFLLDSGVSMVSKCYCIAATTCIVAERQNLMK